MVSRGVASSAVTPGVVDAFGFALELSALGEGKHPRTTDTDPNNIDNINLFIAISYSTKGNEQTELLT
jgi:hypothetical protein